jgi:hypothetical protein
MAGGGIPSFDRQGAPQGRNEDGAADLDPGGGQSWDVGRSPDLLEVLLGDFWDHFDQDILMGYFNGILMCGDLLL